MITYVIINGTTVADVLSKTTSTMSMHFDYLNQQGMNRIE